jgi:GAF domain-containing protein
MLESGEPERDLVDGRPLTEGYGSDGCAADPGSPTPVESLFAIRMAVDEHRLAALTFYADRPDAFDDEDVAAGSVLAGLIGTALQRQAANNKVERLEKALDSARIVGTAVGIVMAKRLLTSEQAFDQLRETSARLHRSLDDVAQAVSDTGDLPTC